MSKIGNHRIGLQESPAYRCGWDWAKRGKLIFFLKQPYLTPEQIRAARQGWQDYHDQEKNDD